MITKTQAKSAITDGFLPAGTAIVTARSAQALTVAYDKATLQTKTTAVALIDRKTGWPSTTDALANLEKLGRHKRVPVYVLAEEEIDLPSWATLLTPAEAGDLGEE